MESDWFLPSGPRDPGDCLANEDSLLELRPIEHRVTPVHLGQPSATGLLPAKRAVLWHRGVLAEARGGCLTTGPKLGGGLPSQCQHGQASLG